MTVNGEYNGTATTGNACTACPDGCTCAGSTAAPVCCSTSKACSDSFSGYSGTYNECTQNQSSQCYKSCTVACSGEATAGCPANASCVYDTTRTYTGTQYYGGSCNAAGTCPVAGFTCNAGYNLTSAGLCAQLCTAGFTELKLGSGVVVPLYVAKQTTTVIGVGYAGSVCYGSLASGEGAGLNVNVNNVIYHTID